MLNFICPLLEEAGLYDTLNCCSACHRTDRERNYDVHIIAGCNVPMCCGVSDALSDGELDRDAVCRIVLAHEDMFTDA